MTARWTLALCGLAAAAEVALVLSMANLAAFTPFDAALLAFVVGPLAFLALLAWRRRTHPARAQQLGQAAAIVAGFGIAVLGYTCYRFHTDQQFRGEANYAPMLLPLFQWLGVLVVWVRLVIAERQEKQG